MPALNSTIAHTVNPSIASNALHLLQLADTIKTAQAALSAGHKDLAESVIAVAEREARRIAEATAMCIEVKGN